MLTGVVKSQVLRCRWVVADAAFGDNPGLLDGVAGLGLWYVADVPHHTRGWQERPATRIPSWRGRGRRPQRERLIAGAPRGADGPGGGDRVARRGVGTPDDQGRQPGAYGRGVCRQTGGGCEGRPARA